MNPYLKHRPKSYEEHIIEKAHPTIRESLAAKINEYNFQIQFIEPTWVIKEYNGGFIGGVIKREMVQIASVPFGVLSVNKDKKKQCSRIHVWSDGMCDGKNCFLINVPNGLFKEIHDE